MVRKSILAAVILGLSAAPPLIATFGAEANKVPEFGEVRKKLVVAPMKCPPS